MPPSRTFNMLWHAARIASTLAAALALFSTATAADGPLRYKLQPGTSLVYKVEIRADRGDEVEVRTGNPEFKVQAGEGGNAKVLLSNPNLGERTERKPGAAARGFGPPRFPSMRGLRSP